MWFNFAADMKAAKIIMFPIRVTCKMLLMKYSSKRRRNSVLDSRSLAFKRQHNLFLWTYLLCLSCCILKYGSLQFNSYFAKGDNDAKVPEKKVIERERKVHSSLFFFDILPSVSIARPHPYYRDLVRLAYCLSYWLYSSLQSQSIALCKVLYSSYIRVFKKR